MRWIPRLAPFLAAFWLLLSGHFTVLLMALGALSVVLVIWIVRRMDIVDHESLPLHLSLRHTPRYSLWLAGKVLQSALAVARQVWSPRGALQPVVDRAPTRDLPALSQVIYANSITMTPGTLSLSVDDEGIEVHSLQRSGISELQAGGMLARVRRLEAR